MTKKDKRPRYVKTLVPLSSGNVAVYAGVRIAHALHEITADMDLYRGVRLAELRKRSISRGRKMLHDRYANPSKQ